MNRLMCSKDRQEVESVKKELFRAGIRSEIRANPVAAALRVPRLELWVQDERDYFNASKLYAAMQEQSNGESNHEWIDPVEDTLPAGERTNRTNGNGEGLFKRGSEPNGKDRLESEGDRAEVDSPAPLDQAGALLEQEIEDLLTREAAATQRCVALETEIKAIMQSLAECQAQRSRSEEQLQREGREMQTRLKAREDALAAAQAKLEARTSELQSQQSTMDDLRMEAAARDAQLKKLSEALTQAKADLGKERESRLAAEQKAGEFAASRSSLEERFLEQDRVQAGLREELELAQAKLRAYAGTLTNLHHRLQAGRTPRN